MTHIETIVHRGIRRLKCPSGCEEPLSLLALVKVGGDGDIRFVWRCAGCHTVTELVVAIADGCWTVDGRLIAKLPDA